MTVRSQKKAETKHIIKSEMTNEWQGERKWGNKSRETRWMKANTKAGSYDNKKVCPHWSEYVTDVWTMQTGHF